MRVRVKARLRVKFRGIVRARTRVRLRWSFIGTHSLSHSVGH